MNSTMKSFQAIAVAALTCASANAFSLNSPAASWMTADLGYLKAGDFGGVTTPGEAYRINQPVVVYGFDQSFVEFFGQEGINAVEAAIKILNDVPAASVVDPANYPVSTSRINHTARRLRLWDVKTMALSQVVAQLGLTSPERFTWTLRQINRPNEVTRLFQTVRRNYDPFTVLPSSFVNGTLYTYQIVLIGVDQWEAQEISLDPAEPNLSVATYGHAGLIDDRALRLSAARGMFYSGLTQDDVGGLRYLYHPGTVAVEQLPSGTTLKTSQTVIQIGSGGGGSEGSWTPYYGVGVATGGGAGGGGTNAVAVVNAAVRRGVDKIQFVRGDIGNPVLANFTRPVVVRYSDSYSTNGVSGAFRTQSVERTLTRPDIIFAAGDLGNSAGGFPIPVAVSRVVNGFVNLSTLNGIAGAPSLNGEPPLGPGINDVGASGLVITFARVGLQELNSNSFDDLTEEQGFTAFMWGSYDGSTNAPIVFPVGRANLRMVESIVRGGN
jgi:hypothetical protein